MQGAFTNKLNAIGADAEFFPGGYTSVLQPYDVGLNRPFNNHIKKSYMNWCVEKYEINWDLKLPFPKRADILARSNKA